MITFEVTADQNPFLPPGETDIDAIVNVQATTGGAVAVPEHHAIVLIVDVSGSMGSPPSKLMAAKAAARVAVENLPTGTRFAVIAGDHEARAVYPATGLAHADADTRPAAVAAIRKLAPLGGTAMDTWLVRARQVFDRDQAAVIRQAVLLTDGYNGSPRSQLEAAVRQNEGHFRCDCRGIGQGWKAEDLLFISGRLQGAALDAPTGEDLQNDFRVLVAAAAKRAANAVRLRIWVPFGAHIRYLKQVAPTIQDLTPYAVPVDGQTFDFPIGDWGTEQRDYQIGVGGLRPDEPDEEDDEEESLPSLAGRVRVVHGGPGAGPDGTGPAAAEILAQWTEDVVRYSEVNQQVARYTGLVGYDEAVRLGISAYGQGDLEQAREHLGRAVQLAYEAGEQGKINLLAHRLVSIIDAATGDVEIRSDVSEHELHVSELRSRWTAPIGG
ncbi:VWA domain-containing protein [Parafrankia elaeagni]|uniref:VWA domain-containing protein n=1 Tax=Parafrankia elaeagni TaxID=222534 RepID=UPI00036D12CD|nr:VWA domain-containing protein [Parafrankia elaeagni]